jgi:DnaJ family protein C protein 11
MPRYLITFFREIEAEREEFSQKLERSKKDAEDAVRIMTPSCQRKQEIEEGSGGLVIVRAIYGKLPSKTNWIHLPVADDWIDVTIPVQSLVIHSTLTISSGFPKVTIFNLIP